jgi:hypothetical protein
MSHQEFSDDFFEAATSGVVGGFALSQLLLAFEAGYHALLSRSSDSERATTHPSRELLIRGCQLIGVDPAPGLEFIETRDLPFAWQKPSLASLVDWARRVREAVGFECAKD